MSQLAAPLHEGETLEKKKSIGQLRKSLNFVPAEMSAQEAIVNLKRGTVVKHKDGRERTVVLPPDPQKTSGRFGVTGDKEGTRNQQPGSWSIVGQYKPANAVKTEGKKAVKTEGETWETEKRIGHLRNIAIQRGIDRTVANKYNLEGIEELRQLIRDQVGGASSGGSRWFGGWTTSRPGIRPVPSSQQEDERQKMLARQKKEQQTRDREERKEAQKAVERERSRKKFMNKLGKDLHTQLRKITAEKIRTLFGSDESAYIKTMVSKKDLNAANYLGLPNYVKKRTVMFEALTQIHHIIKTIWDKKNAFNEEYDEFFSEVFGAEGFNTKPCGFWYNGLNKFTSAFWDFYCTDNAGIDVEYVQKYIEHAQTVCDIVTQGESSIELEKQIENATEAHNLAEAERRRVEERQRVERMAEEERQRVAEEERQRVEKLAEEERQRVAEEERQRVEKLAEEERQRVTEEERQRVEKLTKEDRQRKKKQTKADARQREKEKRQKKKKETRAKRKKILNALRELRQSMKDSKVGASEKQAKILTGRLAEVKQVMREIMEGNRDLDSEEITREYFECQYANEDDEDDSSDEDDLELSDDETDDEFESKGETKNTDNKKMKKRKGHSSSDHKLKQRTY